MQKLTLQVTARLRGWGSEWHNGTRGNDNAYMRFILSYFLYTHKKLAAAEIYAAGISSFLENSI